MTKDEMLKERDRLAEHLDKTKSLHVHMDYTVSKAFIDGFNAALELIERERVNPLRDAAVKALGALSDSRHHGFSLWPEGKNCIQVGQACSPAFDKLEDALAQVERWE